MKEKTLRWLNKWNTPSRVCGCETRDTVFHHISNIEKRDENTMRNGVLLMNIEVFRFWGERRRKDVEHESFNLGTYPNKSRFRIFFVYGLWTINEIEKCQINNFNSVLKKKREKPSIYSLPRRRSWGFVTRSYPPRLRDEPKEHLRRRRLLNTLPLTVWLNAWAIIRIKKKYK